jgi:hypothetical protein
MISTHLFASPCQLHLLYPHFLFTHACTWLNFGILGSKLIDIHYVRARPVLSPVAGLNPSVIERIEAVCTFWGHRVNFEQTPT